MDSLMSSPRPKKRPKLEIPYLDTQKIERVVWEEAKGEGVEGRNAVRGVILNRLASSRWLNTVDGVLIPSEFEAVPEDGNIFKIEAPEQDLQNQYAEFADYVQLGKDAVDGRTFFQNEKTTSARGTSFDGPDELRIGNHTFYRGYGKQEPVLDTQFSHNVTITYPDQMDTMEYSLGGLATATRGITTEEGRIMANKKFQLDDKKADLNGDNTVDPYERARGEAIQKNLQDAPTDEVASGDKREEVNMYHGGTAMECGCGAMEECGCDGSMMDGIMGYDDVSGNPIPIGSNPENVRDDIEANISTDEYVLPAHVVKWHGLKHIQMMQSEAEMGLMSLQMDGLIQYADNEDKSNSEGVEDSEVSDASNTQQKEAEAEAQASEEIPSEEMDVEVATFEVDDMLDETEGTEKISPKTSKLPGMVKKQKIAFLY